MARRSLPVLLILLGLATHPAAAQCSRGVHHYSLAELDLGFDENSCWGVRVYAAPSMRTTVGAKRITLAALHFDPDSVLPWVDTVRSALARALTDDEPDGVRWGPGLLDTRGLGGLQFGRQVQGHELRDSHYLMLADSVTTWKVNVTAAQVDELLGLLRTVGMHSHINPDLPRLPPGYDSTVFLERPVAVESRPAVRWQGKAGRAVIEYVVDTTGRAEMTTFIALIATSPDVEAEARRVTAETRFRPARQSDGKLARQLVHQNVVFHSAGQ